MHLLSLRRNPLLLLLPHNLFSPSLPFSLCGSPPPLPPSLLKILCCCNPIEREMGSFAEGVYKTFRLVGRKNQRLPMSSFPTCFLKKCLDLGPYSVDGSKVFGFFFGGGGGANSKERKGLGERWGKTLVCSY